MHGLILAVVNLKDGKQFGNLQKIADALGQPRKFDGATAIVGSGIEGYQCSEPAAIDVGDIGQVQNYAIVLGKEVFHLITQ